MKQALLKASGLALLLGAAGGAHAQIKSLPYNPSVYVMPEIGYFNPDNRFGTEDKGPEVGLRFGKAINQYFDVRVGGSYAKASGDNTRYQQTMIGVDGLLFLSRDTLRPFVSLGIGAENDRRNIPNFQNSRTSPYAAAGVGLQWAFADQWATEVEYKKVVGFQRSGAFGFKRDENNYVNVGLTYYFDKTPTVVARADTPPPPRPVAQTAPPPPPPPAPRFEKVTMSASKMFAFDSAVIRQPAPKLDEIADVLKANPSVANVKITGYTDRIGKPAYNVKLSQRRADAVKAYLVGKGIDGSRLTTEGKGEADPIVQCSEKNQKALIACLEPNRRVEVEDVTIEKRVR
jgi:OOP family OmpA-OmpF porin